MSTTTTQDVHDALRELEVEAPSIDTAYQSKDDRHPHFYLASQIKRGTGLSSAYLAEHLADLFEISDSKARTLIRDATNEGRLIRLGAGNATGYRTSEEQDRLDAEEVARSNDLLALAARAEAVGLTVSLSMNRSWSMAVQGTAAAQADMLRNGSLVRDASISDDLATVVRLLEDALLS